MDFLKRCWCEINLDALQANVALLRREAGKELFAVVKANAYGHGDRVLAPQIQALGVEKFAVSNLNEARTLRRVGIGGEILILGYTPASYAAVLAEEQLSQAVFSTEYAKALQAEAKRAGVVVPVHLKIDTGMGRIGFNAKHGKTPLDELLAVCRAEEFRVQGIFTHYAVADSFAPEDLQYSDRQSENFDRVVQALRDAGVCPPVVHIQNSAGILNRDHDSANYARMGIALYGLKPSDDVKPAGEELQPLLSWKATIGLVKPLEVGDAVCYGRTYVADQPRMAATVTVGYADGYRRDWSNTAEVLVHGKRCPVIGRVCMDQLVVDVTGVPAQMGDEVTLMGQDGQECITADELAALAGTINYEIVCGISRRVPRVYLKQGAVIAVEDDSIRSKEEFL